MSKIASLYMILRQWIVTPKHLCSTRLYLLNKIIPCHLKKQCVHQFINVEGTHHQHHIKKKGSVPIQTEGMYTLHICHSGMNYIYRYVLHCTLSTV